MTRQIHADEFADGIQIAIQPQKPCGNVRARGSAVTRADRINENQIGLIQPGVFVWNQFVTVPRDAVEIGRLPEGLQQAVADFVLSNYSTVERKELPFQVGDAADAVESLITDGLEKTQQRFNS